MPVGFTIVSRFEHWHRYIVYSSLKGRIDSPGWDFLGNFLGMWCAVKMNWVDTSMLHWPFHLGNCIELATSKNETVVLLPLPISSLIKNFPELFVVFTSLIFPPCMHSVKLCCPLHRSTTDHYLGSCLGWPIPKLKSDIVAPPTWCSSDSRPWVLALIQILRSGFDYLIWKSICVR